MYVRIYIKIHHLRLNKSASCAAAHNICLSRDLNFIYIAVFGRWRNAKESIRVSNLHVKKNTAAEKRALGRIFDQSNQIIHVTFLWQQTKFVCLICHHVE